MSNTTETPMKISPKNEDYSMSLYVDSVFYESLSRYEYELNLYNIAFDLLGNDETWEFKKDRIFISCINNKSYLPNQGWKIHISGTPKNSEEILSRTISICNQYETSFKFLCDNYLLSLSSSKGWPRGSSGKFITIYPRDESTFIRIINELYVELRNFEGPYILSDKRYKDDCKVLFYRYGGIIPEVECNSQGALITYLKSPIGEKIPDTRLPFYNKPYWVNDPFGEEISSEHDKLALKNGRYEIIRLLKFSNSGGVFIAFDNQLNTKVIIKEARPYTIMNQHNDLDAVKLRKREWDIINIMHREQLVPKPIDNFYEWEHYYIVESIIDGEDLQSFTAVKNPLLFSNLNTSKEIELKKYYENMIEISKNLSISLQLFHDNNIVIGDFSTFNIMVRDNLSVSFPDLEGSYVVKDGYTRTKQFTPGYYNEKYTTDDSSPYLNDYYALGCTICNMFTPQTNQYKINPAAPEKFIRELVRDYTLPEDLAEVIVDLIYFTENVSITDIISRLNDIQLKNVMIRPRINKKLNSDDFIKSTIKGIVKFILNTASLHRDDRLFPSDANMINPLNISHGAMGILASLKKMGISIPEEFVNWVKTKEVSVQNYPPGLYNGLAGIAWSLLEIDEVKYGIEIMELANSHHYKDASPDIYSGLAGIGLANLHFWNYTGDIEYLRNAEEYALRIIKMHKRDPEGIFWESTDKITRIGYAKGSSGIALFLLYLSIAIDNDKFLMYGKKALEFDLNNIYISESITSIPRTTDTPVVSPYWLNGSAGVCTTIIRYYYYTKDIKYKDALKILLPDVTRKYTYNPGLFEGLAGLGNILLDCYQFLDDESYLEKAKFVASGIELYKINKNKGIAFPGNLLFRISNDYATGSVGIAAFYNRLLNNTKNDNYLLDWLLK